MFNLPTPTVTVHDDPDRYAFLLLQALGKIPYGPFANDATGVHAGCLVATIDFDAVQPDPFRAGWKHSMSKADIVVATELPGIAAANQREVVYVPDFRLEVYFHWTDSGVGPDLYIYAYMGEDMISLGEDLVSLQDALAMMWRVAQLQCTIVMVLLQSALEERAAACHP
jgi:hypothetical protein